MRLKKLSLCLFALSLVGCSSHVIKSNSSATNSLDQRAVNAANALFEYPSYDYNGTFKFAVDTDQSVKNGTKAPLEQRMNDPELEKQVRAVLKAQRVNLTSAQLEQLYQAIASENSAEESSPRSKKFEGFILGLLSEMQFSYDGSMHYKQKLASMNLTAKYEKPTLLVQAKVPMVVDFNQYKFYTNYFALMPLMVNKESQSTLAYVDFSKYKKEIERIDLKSLVAYMKESGALPYILADTKDIQKVALNEQDKAQGAVEKIRLNISLEEWMLQSRLFEQINKPYLKEKMAAVFSDEKDAEVDARAATTAEEAAAEAVEAASEAEAAVSALSTYGMTETEAEAYHASQKLYQLVNAHFMPIEEAEEASVACGTAACDAAAATDAAAEGSCSTAEECAEEASAAATDAVAATEEDESSEANYISEKECQALVGQAKRPLIGDVAYCNAEYEIDVLAKDGDTGSTGTSDLPSFVKTVLSEEKTELDQKFEQYVSTDFKDAKAFKVLWDQHQADVKKELSTQGNNPVIMDVALDDKGRAVRFDYDVRFKTTNSGTLNFKTDMNILNYGHATAINRAELNRAKSIEDVSKDSIMENMVKGFSKSLGVDASQTETGIPKSRQSLDQQLDDLAIQVYDSTKSYTKTYEALFILKMSAEQPELVKLYSTAELNEIARVYAYAYADESIFNPQGKAQDELDRLVKKHHLELNGQYNDDVGEAVYNKVVSAIEGQKERQEWQKFAQKHKTAKAAFTEYYIAEFLSDYEEDDLDVTQKKELRRTAQVLAQAYEDTRKNKLTDKTIQTLTEDDVGYIDYGLYRTVFDKVSQSFK